MPIFDISIQLNLYQYCITGLMYHDMAIYRYYYCYISNPYFLFKILCFTYILYIDIMRQDDNQVTRNTSYHKILLTDR